MAKNELTRGQIEAVNMLFRRIQKAKQYEDVALEIRRVEAGQNAQRVRKERNPHLYKPTCRTCGQEGHQWQRCPENM